MESPALPPSPYPGLRAFRPSEAPIFCGRAESHADVLDLLGQSRFLAVVGASGSGKSSLVLAGLLPDIREGLLIGVDPEAVHIASLQPGLRPFANLAAALGKELRTDLEIEPVLRRGPLGVAQLLDQLAVPAEAALVIVVDQFEELFRFAGFTDEELLRQERGRAGTPLLDGAHNEAQAFVSLLLETAAQTRHQVFVILTMRSDYIGRCDEFTGLPAAISHSQFLTPRLNRQQLEQAIVRPLDLYGAAAQPELVNLILNRVSPEQDQLPLLQHALARTWQHARTRVPSPEPVTLTVEDYKLVGGLADALNQHADEVCSLLAASPLAIGDDRLERFFRALGHHDLAGQAPVRRPVRVKRMAEETGLDPGVVRAVADAFRAEGCHLLVPPPARVPELQDDTVLDIGHETLLRQWAKLKAWMAVEWRERQTLESLATAMTTWERDAPAADGDIVRRFDRFKQAGETVATSVYREASRTLFSTASPRPWLPFWVDRYQVDWPRLDRYRREAFLWKRVTSVLSTAGFGLVILSGLLVGMTVFAFYQRNQSVHITQALKQSNLSKDQETAKAKAALEAEREARLKLNAEARRAQSSQEDAFNQLKASRDDANRQAASLAASVRTVLRDDKGAISARNFVESLNNSGLLPLDAIEKPAATPGEPESFPDILPSPVSFPLPPDMPGSNALSFLKTPVGLFVLSGSADNATTRCWTLDGQASGVGKFPFKTTTLVPAPDGSVAAALTEDSGQQVIINPESAIPLKAYGAEQITAARWVSAANKSLLLHGTAKGTIGVFDPNTGFMLSSFPSGVPNAVRNVVATPDGKAVVAIVGDGAPRLFPLPQGFAGLAAGKEPPSHQDAPGNSPLHLTTLSPDGRYALSALTLMDLQLQPLRAGSSPVGPLRHHNLLDFENAAFSPNGRIIATTDGSNAVYLWDVDALLRNGSSDATPFVPLVLLGHRTHISHLRWASDGGYLITGDRAGVTILWQHPLERLQGKFNDVPLLLPSHPGGVTSTAIAPDNRFVATAGRDSKVNIYPLDPILRGKFIVRKSPASGGGGLALFADADADPKLFPGLFLPTQPPGTEGPAYRLNPDAFYLSARWDYTFTSRSMLRNTKVSVRRIGPDGKVVGPDVQAQPVDWGPRADTGKTFDVSPGLQQKLGLQDGDQLEMEMSMIAPFVEKKDATANGR